MKQLLNYYNVVPLIAAILICLLAYFNVTPGYRPDFKYAFYANVEFLRQNNFNFVIYPKLDEDDISKLASVKYIDKHMPDCTFISVFPYQPISTLVFLPFTYLNINLATQIWLILNLSTLIICYKLLAKAFDQNDSKIGKHIAFNFGFLIMVGSIFISLYLGQTAIIFGLLPITLGVYFSLVKNRYFLSGMIWSLTLFKPQFVYLAIILSVSMVLSRNSRHSGLKNLAGFLAGLILQVIFNIVLFGWETFLRWIHFNQIYATHTAQWVKYLYLNVMTLSLSTIELLNAHHSTYLKLGLFIISFIGLIFTILVNLKILNSDKLSEKIKFILIFLVSASSLPIIEFYYCYYDLVFYPFIYLVLINCFNLDKSKRLLNLSKILLFTITIINLYGLGFRQDSIKFLPTLMVLFLITVYGLIVKQCLEMAEEKNIGD